MSTHFGELEDNKERQKSIGFSRHTLVNIYHVNVVAKNSTFEPTQTFIWQNVLLFFFQMRWIIFSYKNLTYWFLRAYCQISAYTVVPNLFSPHSELLICHELKPGCMNVQVAVLLCCCMAVWLLYLLQCMNVQVAVMLCCCCRAYETFLPFLPLNWKVNIAINLLLKQFPSAGFLLSLLLKFFPRNLMAWF